MEKFLAGRCSEEEAEEVIRCLHDSPILMEQYFSKSEWDVISDSNTVPPGLRDKMLGEIRKATNTERPLFTINRHWYSAAAILLFCVGLISLFRYMNSKDDAMCETLKKKIENTSTVKDSLLVFLNSGDRIKEEKLPDGSLVRLSSNSAITINKDFIKDKREVQLTGQAYFHVAKDPQRPFIVYSNGISTTAIGTSFTITAYRDSSNVRVQLHTGKIKIADITSGIPKWKEAYLVAGQSFYVDAQRATTKIQTESPVLSKNTNILLPLPKSVTDLVFDQEPLQAVFEKLQQQFNVKLEYTTNDLAGLHFTGTIHPVDQIENILKKISLLNNLNYTKKDKGYKIEKVN